MSLKSNDHIRSCQSIIVNKTMEESTQGSAKHKIIRHMKQSHV